MPGGISIQALSGQLLDDVAQQLEIEIRVGEALARRRDGHLLDDPPDGLLLALEGRLEVEIGPEAGYVREQVADRDPILPVPPESLHVSRHAVRQPQAAVLDQRHDRGRRGDDLRQRRQIEDRIERHRLGGGRQRPVSEGVPVEHRRAPAGDDHGPRHLAIGNGLLDDRANQGQARRVEAAGLRRRRTGPRRPGLRGGSSGPGEADQAAADEGWREDSRAWRAHDGSSLSNVADFI